MTLGYVYPISAWTRPGDPPWVDLANTFDQDWDTYGLLEWTHMGPPPLIHSFTHWVFDSIVTDRIRVKISGFVVPWGGTLSVVVDGVRIYVHSGGTLPLGTFTFPCGVLTEVRLTVATYSDSGIYAEVYEVAVPFTADFSVSPPYGCALQEITFTNLSLPADPCGITLVIWDFGDESSFEGWTPPPHTYAEPGIYTVSLHMIWQATDVEETKVEYLYIGGWLPDFVATPLAGCSPLMVKFTGSWPGPPGMVAAHSYKWQVDDQDFFEADNPAYHTFCTPGTYDITVTVNDGVCETLTTKTAYISTAAGFCPTCVQHTATDDDRVVRDTSTHVYGDTIVCTYIILSTDHIYFVRSDDRGETWTAPVQVDSVVAGTMRYTWPHIRIIDTDTIYIIWESTVGGVDGIYFSKSIDGGATFQAPVKIVDEGTLPCDDRDPAFMAIDSAGRILVTWISGSSWCFASSIDAGATWINKQVVATLSGADISDICVDNTDRIVLIGPSSGSIVVYVSIDNGATFAGPHMVAAPATGNHHNDFARITSQGINLYAAWVGSVWTPLIDDYLYYVESASSLDNGVTWSVPVRVDTATEPVLYDYEPVLGLGFVGPTLVVSWLPYWGNSPPVHLKSSSNGGAIWGNLLKVCVPWWSDPFDFAYGPDYIAAGWGYLDDPGALRAFVCEWPSIPRTYFFLA